MCPPTQSFQLFSPMFSEAVTPSLTTPTNDTTMPGILNPQRGKTMMGEIVCYRLPFGALGFSSHILTYYTIVCLSFGRRPLWPWHKLRYPRHSLWLSVLGMMGGLGLATFTIARCHNNLELLLIGIWTTSMSAFNGAVGIHTHVAVERMHKKGIVRLGSESSFSSREHLLGQNNSKEVICETPPINGTRGVWWWILLCEPPRSYFHPCGNS
jgi:hypothetical protein